MQARLGTVVCKFWWQYPGIEICTADICSAVHAAEIAHGCTVVPSVISVSIPVFRSQKNFKGGRCPLRVRAQTPEIFVVV